VKLFYIEGKCYNEIVELMGQEWNQVRSFIQNGRRNLKICMERPQVEGKKSGV
jgi:RNA polymerase sigma-70 factor (ECF subfamily)